MLTDMICVGLLIVKLELKEYETVVFICKDVLCLYLVVVMIMFLISNLGEASRRYYIHISAAVNLVILNINSFLGKDIIASPITTTDEITTGKLDQQFEHLQIRSREPLLKLDP